ncbi:MAG: PRC-barrel domain-containing protein [Cytophagaceae bacterium]|nr:PRC-barrel domain-containing protein [Cytophagaceae bacterium]
MEVINSDFFIGDKVENTKGEPIGKIRNIMLNVQYGKIECIIIEFGGFMGLGEKLFAVPFTALQLNRHKQDFVLDVDKSFLEKAPGFDKDHWPETNGHYFVSLDKD